MPDFQSAAFLRQHIEQILAFYEPNVVDQVNGGFHQNFYDNGSIFDPQMKHLVSSTRMIFNYCKAYQYRQSPEDLVKVQHGLKYLREAHWDPKRQGYNWLMSGADATDQTNHCYGLAFVILALAACLNAGLDDVKKELYQCWAILNQRFWLADSALYADEASPDWQTLSDYRGQNANMHCCEALLLAYQATTDQQFLDRAYVLAKTFALTLSEQANGLIWEHYTADLKIDWEYNKTDPKNLYRPWGFQPGHQTEWAKLLLTLYRYRPEAWMVQRAQMLFDTAMELCWDPQYGGILYGHAPDGRICDDDKYFWVQAESFAAAALLAKQTGQQQYWDWYNKIWQYSWQHMVDHRYGAWFRVLKRHNEKYSEQKSTAGGKCDYHTLSACWEVLALLEP